MMNCHSFPAETEKAIKKNLGCIVLLLVRIEYTLGIFQLGSLCQNNNQTFVPTSVLAIGGRQRKLNMIL